MTKEGNTNSGTKNGSGIGTAASATKGNGKGKGKGHPKRYGAMGGYGGVKYSDAAHIIGGQIRHIVRGYKNQKDQTRDLYQKSKGDINHIFDSSGNYIMGANQKIADSYAAQKSAMDSIYGALNGQLKSGASGIQDAAMAELQRMGINPGAAGDMSSDANFMQAMVMGQQANSGANMAAQAQGSDAVGQLLLGMNSGAKSSALGQAINTRNSGLSDINAQIRDARSGRGDAINQLLMQMNDSRFQQWLGLQNLRMSRRSMNSSIASSNAGALQNASYYQTLANQLQGQLGNGGSKGSKGSKGSNGSAPGSSHNRDQYAGGLWYGSGA